MKNIYVATVLTLLVVVLSQPAILEASGGALAVITQQMGVKVPAGKAIQINNVMNGSVVDAAKLNRFVNKPGFASSRGEVVKVKFVSDKKFEMAFPSQGMKAKLHFKGSDEELQAIIDWLGSLEAQE